MLIGQHAVGPRFFVPACFNPSEETWNWHPSPEVLHDMLGIDVESHDGLGTCSVCLQPNEWKDAATPSVRTRLFRRRPRKGPLMVTPVRIC